MREYEKALGRLSGRKLTVTATRRCSIFRRWQMSAIGSSCRTGTITGHSRRMPRLLVCTGIKYSNALASTAKSLIGYALRYRLSTISPTCLISLLFLVVPPLVKAQSLTITTASLPDAGQPNPYPGVNLEAQGGTQPYTWSATGLPTGLEVSAAGLLAGIPAISGNFNPTFIVTDSSTPQQIASKTLQLKVWGLIITTGSLPSGMVNQTYVGATLQAQSGDPPYKWSATGLPPGLSLSAAGVLGGTPTTSGTFAVIVSLTDSGVPYTSFASTTLSLTIASSLAITSALFPSGVVNQAYTGANFQAQNGTVPYTWSATGLPPGMSINPAGVVGGTPTSAGTFSVTVTVTDSSAPEQTSSVVISLTIASGLTVTTTSLPGGASNKAYPGATLQAQGGTSPYTWSVTGLPPGLILSTAGALGGTPTSTGTFSAIVTVTDSSTPKQSASATLSLTIASGLAVTTTSLPGGASNQVYPGATLQAQGGTSPYTWSATGLPPGLILSAAGVLGGTPTSSGTFSVTVTATDTSTPKQTASATLQLAIASGVTAIITTSLPNGAFNQAYPGATLQAQGGTAPYTWYATGLPAGLSLSTTGVLSGTPSTAGTFGVTIAVADATGQTASKVYSVSISPPPPPLFTISISAQPTAITDQPGLTLNLNQPYPLPLDVQLTLSFTPDAGGLPSGDYSGPALQFASGGTSVTVTVQPNSTSWPLPSVQIGDVAGTIVVTLVEAQLGGTSQALELSNPLPSAPITVPRIAPAISAGSVRITKVTATGFNVEVVATSTPRDLTSALVTFAAATGAQLTGTSFDIPLSDTATQWFSSTDGLAAGGSFRLTIPFPFSGDTSAIGSVSVMLTNSIGTSASVSGTQ